jgi:hypothetical protein
MAHVPSPMREAMSPDAPIAIVYKVVSARVPPSDLTLVSEGRALLLFEKPSCSMNELLEGRRPIGCV